MGKYFVIMIREETVFGPIFSRRLGSSLDRGGTDGYYWSSSLYALYEGDPSFAWSMSFYSDYQGVYGRDRSCGHSVRAVRSRN